MAIHTSKVVFSALVILGVSAFAASTWAASSTRLPTQLFAQIATGQNAKGPNANAVDPEASRQALQRAQQEAKEAEERAERLTEQAQAATQAAEKTARETAALAARIQQSEAETNGAEARLALITDQRRQLDRRLAVRQQPLVRLTGALQNMARRPLSLSALQPGSLKDTVYARAVLETTLPQIRSRTATLRSELERGRSLERSAALALAQLRSSETELENRRGRLANLELRQRTTSREASGIAYRENERALLLAEEARNLDTLIDRLGEANSLRSELAALDGPIIRPERPGASQVLTNARAAPVPRATQSPSDLQLPVQGRVIAGFGAQDVAGNRSKGISLSARDGAQIVSPGSGRVAFAGPYRGFGRIVIIEHVNGWTSLVTGLGQSEVVVGDRLVGGSPLGVAAGNDAIITFELRRDGSPINPLEYM
ncbi:MAG: peptidoglycan DD-metalloendopeptidase family protein [Erythrobacter sp.]